MTTAESCARLEERLLRYVQIDTESQESLTAQPSTQKQFDLLREIERELLDIGVADVRLFEYGALIATIPASDGTDAPTVAFFAHVDTTEAYPGANVKPRVHRAYDGGEIRFPENDALLLSPSTNAYLGERMGDDIVTASGGTLLGADDKAGCAIIMTLAERLTADTSIQHGPVKFVFTTDEEIGRGVPEHLPDDVDADVGYTLDGADRGEIVYETFSGDKAVVSITGVSTHPGDAKDTMVNAIHLAGRILAALPADARTPETTDGRDGFIHCHGIDGTAAHATLEFILRDFEREGLEQHGDVLRAVCDDIAASEPRATIDLTITPQYRNMRYWLENDMRPVEVALDACRSIGIEPFSPPTRGGTDGSRLTELGLPTPNLFTGMQNFHGPLEWVSVQDMALSVDLCTEIVRRWAGEAR